MGQKPRSTERIVVGKLKKTLKRIYIKLNTRKERSISFYRGHVTCVSVINSGEAVKYLFRHNFQHLSIPEIKALDNDTPPYSSGNGNDLLKCRQWSHICALRCKLAWALELSQTLSRTAAESCVIRRRIVLQIGEIFERIVHFVKQAWNLVCR